MDGAVVARDVSEESGGVLAGLTSAEAAVPDARWLLGSKGMLPPGEAGVPVRRRVGELVPA